MHGVYVSVSHRVAGKTDTQNFGSWLRTRHAPGSQQDPASRISRIQDPGSWRILNLIFLFSHGILKILDPVTTTLPLDPRNPGLRTDHTLLDPGDSGSTLSKLSWDLAVLGSSTTIITVFWTSIPSNEILPLVPRIYALVNLDHRLKFQADIDSTILYWDENKPSLLVP